MQTTWIKRKWDVLLLIIAGAFGLCTLGAVGYQGREQAKRVVCSTHISQNVQALLAYAADYDGDLPSISNGGWLQDMSVNTINQLLDYGATQETFYCPSNEAHQRNLMQVWMFYWGNNQATWEQHWDGQRFSGCFGWEYLVSGYLFLLSGGSRDDSDIHSYDSDTVEKTWLDSIYMTGASYRELVTDNIMGEKDEDARWGYNFGHVIGGLASYGIIERSSHLISDEEPAGGNIGFLDGHVSWRKWDPPTYPMVVNGKAVPRWNASGPASWW